MTVALLAGARQRRLVVGFKGFGKVGRLLRESAVIGRRRMARGRPRRRGACLPFEGWLRSRLAGR